MHRFGEQTEQMPRFAGADPAHGLGRVEDGVGSHPRLRGDELSQSPTNLPRPLLPHHAAGNRLEQASFGKGGPALPVGTGVFDDGDDDACAYRG